MYKSEYGRERGEDEGGQGIGKEEHAKALGQEGA